MGKRKNKNAGGDKEDSAVNPVNGADDSTSEEQAENESGESGNEPEESEEENGFSNDPASLQTGSNSQLRRMMDQNFIEYASYVIKDRAIPDIDDGLKPVQRRILWALYKIDDGSFHKVANVIGDTMKYHPHGDASIGDALVHLANKEMFIDRQGNFGNIITGDPAAAGRYIECRLTPLAKDVLYNNDITEFIDSYDGRNREPVCLPSKIPSLLMMGSDGIAVGTNTKIMSHNFNELLEAQIAILKGENFTLYPDFLQGGTMDVSKYEDGMGKIVIRAKIELDGRRLIVREIPAYTDTAKLMDSIEKAMNKNKIKIASIHDYTGEKVEIEIVPIRGYDPEKALNALYAYTHCSVSITCNPMVICENRPVRMSVSEILRRNTDKLLEYLRRELEIEAGKCLDKLLARTLAQIFVEEGIYKRIEKCKTYELIVKEVRTGLEKHREEWLPIVKSLWESLELRGIDTTDKHAVARLEQLSKGQIPDSEVEKLLEIPIRRISLFDINKNREEMELLQQTLDEANKNLKRLKNYAIRYLKGILDKYGKLFPRRTVIELDGFEKIDKSAVALNNIRVGWDKKNCYIGTDVKSEDVVICNEFDHLLCIERKGSYKVINIPEKIFIDRLYEFRKYDKTTVFGIVYSDTKTGKVYYKRCAVDKFITDKEYRICPEGCRLELVTPRPNAVYECQIDTPIKAKKIQSINLSEAPVRSARAGGLLLFPRKMLKITFVQYLDGTEQSEEPALIQVPSESQETASDDPPPQKPAAEETDAAPKTIVEKPARPRKKTEPSSAKGNDEDKSDENWGITQPDLGF